jgi:O-methyltransferase involved in polyketide biosynthesis
VKVALAGVPETLLWTLWQRAVEARRPDAVLADPKAVELVDAIEYPFADRFGDGAGFAQWQALRVLRFDTEVRRFLAANPDGTVVALGEGLETQFWRVDNGRVRWVTVDVPETIAVRERLLPAGDRQAVVAGSAFEPGWMDRVDASRGLLVTAQGLFMYFPFEAVERLIETLASRFPGATLIFDAVPPWLARRSRRPPRGDGYHSPPWLWGIDADKRRRLHAHPLRLPRGRGVFHGYIAPAFRLSVTKILRTRL